MARSQTIGNQTSSFRDTQQHDAEKPSTRKMGVLVLGLPKTKKIDRLEKFMMGSSAPHRRSKISKHEFDVKFHLHYCQWYNGNESTGEGVYTFGSGIQTELEDFTELMNGQRIDKKHSPIRACVAPICFNCHFPLDCEDTPGHLPKGNLEKASTLNKHICDRCLPSPIHCCCCDTILPDDESQSGYRRSSSDAHACRSCWNDSDIQEKWRYNDENNLITTETSSYVEELYLSDEAIEREKALMGGVPPKPCPDITPFSSSFHIKDLIDPESRDYWPFGMNAQQYIEYKELMRFNNPMEETPDESWRGIEVTEEVLQNYSQDLQIACEKFNYSTEDRGKLPAEIVAADCKYRLVENCHGFTCDSPVCQAVFQHYSDTDGGAFGALVAKGIPIFTTRPGNILGNPREAGFGQERCIACVSKVLPCSLPSDSFTGYTNSVKISRFTTDRKL